MLFQWGKMNQKFMFLSAACTKNRENFSPNFSAGNFLYGFLGASQKCIVVVLSCSGMDATNSNSRDPTNFRSQTFWQVIGLGYAWTIAFLIMVRSSKFGKVKDSQQHLLCRNMDRNREVAEIKICDNNVFHSIPSNFDKETYIPWIQAFQWQSECNPQSHECYPYQTSESQETFLCHMLESVCQSCSLTLIVTDHGSVAHQILEKEKVSNKIQ